MNGFRGSISYANVTATLALVVALGGTSYAAVNLPKHSVGSKQIKKDAVSSRKVKDESLTGSDVDESTLGKVPSATLADTATNATNAGTLEGKPLRGIQQWVHVSNTGVVESQSGGVTATKLAATGRYRVSFPSDITACGLSANAGALVPAPDASNFLEALVVLGRSTTGVNDVQIQVYNPNGTSIDEPFFLTVQC